MNAPQAPAQRPATGPYTEADAFNALADAVLQPHPAAERSSLYLVAEASDFLRFNHARLRQATSVQQAHATLAVERGLRRAEATLSLSGHLGTDAQRLQAEHALLLAALDGIPDDPWLRRPERPSQSHRDDRGQLPEAGALIAQVHAQAGTRLQQDLVGFYAGGPMVRAFADSLGSRHWHRVENFQFNWCHYLRADRAVKTGYAGTHWDDAVFSARLDQAAQRLPLLRLSERVLSPGAYRAAFSHAAMAELLGTLNWGGFSLKARRTGVSPLMRLARGEAQFSPQVHLDEAVAQASAPAFSTEGFQQPGRIALVQAGALPADGGTLNAPRSAAEYGQPCNGVGAAEAAEALHLATGTLPQAELLKALDTGLYVSNLHYLNFSDRMACRVTGMTRYACFWVEGGELVAPVNVMRFDDDALRLLGSGLVGLTDTAELFPESDTYDARQLRSVTTPAAVVDGFALTL